LLITVGRIAPFIATLAGLVCYRSISLVLGDGGEIRSPTAMLGDFGQSGIPLPGVTNNAGRPLDLPWSVIAFVLVAVLGHYVLTRTRLGRYFVAVGANERAAAYSAIPVARVKTLSYVILGGFVGLAAFLLTARFNSVSTSQMGQLDELDAIAAVVIGGTSMAGGSGRIWGTFVGVLILGVINTLLVGTVSPYWQGMVKGLIILLAVLIQREQARR
jgi:ribose transport system permease protein